MYHRLPSNLPPHTDRQNSSGAGNTSDIGTKTGHDRSHKRENSCISALSPHNVRRQTDLSQVPVLFDQKDTEEHVAGLSHRATSALDSRREPTQAVQTASDAEPSRSLQLVQPDGQAECQLCSFPRLCQMRRIKKTYRCNPWSRSGRIPRCTCCISAQTRWNCSGSLRRRCTSRRIRKRRAYIHMLLVSSAPPFKRVPSAGNE